MIITNNEGCSDTSDCVLIYNVGLENIGHLEFAIYPSPTSTKLTIETNFEIQEIVITDLKGTIVLLDKTIKEIDLNYLTPGIYMLKVTDGEGNYGIKRIVKQ